MATSAADTSPTPSLDPTLPAPPGTSNRVLEIGSQWLLFTGLSAALVLVLTAHVFRVVVAVTRYYKGV